MGLFGAIGAYIGGRRAAKEQKALIDAQNDYNHPLNVRRRAEKAGINPILVMGPGVGMQDTTGVPMMGQAIANAGAAVDEGISQYQEQKAYAAQLEQQNAELRKALEGQTLRPNTVTPRATGAASLFGSRLPSDGDSLAFGDIPEIQLDPFGNPLMVRGPLADRGEEVKPLQNEPWFKKVSVFDKDLIVWNDEASESEIGSTISMMSLPFQYAFRKVGDPLFEPGKGIFRQGADGKYPFFENWKKRPTGHAVADPDAIRYDMNWRLE